VRHRRWERPAELAGKRRFDNPRFWPQGLSSAYKVATRWVTVCSASEGGGRCRSLDRTLKPLAKAFVVDLSRIVQFDAVWNAQLLSQA
jgi:hypothetical protein